MTAAAAGTPVTLIWTAGRRELHDQLVQLNPGLGGFYGYALNHLQTAPNPGEQRARMVLIAHAIRELVNNLPEAFADVDGFPRRGPSDVAARCKNLAAVWDQHEDHLGDAAAFQTSFQQPADLVSVPRGVLSAAAGVVTAQNAGTSKRRLRQSAVVLRRLETGRDATLEMWLGTLDWFQKHMHFDVSQEHDVPTDDAILTHLEVLERVLSARLGGFFKVMGDLAAIAALANASPDVKVTTELEELS